MIAPFLFQISDFGMARDVTDASVYMSSGGLIPVRWTAPEVYITARPVYLLMQHANAMYVCICICMCANVLW